ncbi:MAG: 6-hydroxymethylpterin diphosphokinase MptE-like protein [Opitutaceae bacterium]
MIHALHSPGSTTCVVMGGQIRDWESELNSYSRILWCIDAQDFDRSSSQFTSAKIRVLIIGNNNSNFVQVIEEFIQHNGRSLPCIFVHEQVLAHSNESYLSALTDIQSVFGENHRARITRQKDGFLWQSHVLQNLSHYVSRRVPGNWHNALAGLPAFVCGAGPSLDVTAPLISKHQKGAVIFAADSSLRTLHRHGVCADFAVSIDVAKRPEKCLPADGRVQRVILAPTSFPTWVGAVNLDDCYFLTSGQVTTDWLSANGVAPTELLARENCGNTALELAHYLGCAPIYLFGLDLALDNSNSMQRHTAAVDATLYSKSGFEAEQNHPTVPGNYAETVPTFAEADWRSLDQRLSSWPASLVTNVNDRGARFSNTTLVHPDRFIFSNTTGEKNERLAQLSLPAPSEIAASTAVNRIGDSLSVASKQIQALHSSFNQRGSLGALDFFRQLMIKEDMQIAFGAFTFKILPHLIDPIDDNSTNWAELIREFEALAQITIEQT